jgi:hypothetical protein
MLINYPWAMFALGFAVCLVIVLIVIACEK